MDFAVLVLYALALLPALRAVSGRTGFSGVRVSVVLLLVLTLGQSALALYTDALWFRELRAEPRFWRELSARWSTFLVGFLVSFALLALNALLVRRGGDKRPHLAAVHEGGNGGTTHSGPQWTITLEPQRAANTFDRVRWIILLAAALVLGTGLATQWWTLLQYTNRESFGVADPQFHRDVSFYLFTLPAWKAVAGWLFGVVLVCIIATALLQILPAAIAGARAGGFLTALKRGARHLGILVGVLFAIGAWQVWISRYELVFSKRGPLVGVGAVDAHVGAPLLAVYAAVLVVLGLTAAVLAARFSRRTVTAFLAVWGGATFLQLGIVPALYEALVVKPSQLQQEKPYILRHLDMTRRAFDLDSTRVRVKDIPAPVPLSAADVRSDAETITNLRLADWRPLLHTYNQLQTLRTYYRFSGVDVDRYVVNGATRAVMLSLRELDSEKVPSQGAGGWDINRWFIYTHGYGVCMNSVNEFSPEGIPRLLVRDLPPVSTVPEITLTRPEIYFGELTTNPVMVLARGQQEFDYPRGDDNIFTTYKGTAGIPLGSTASLRRLAFALRFHSLKFFLSSYIAPETRVLMTRDLASRVRRLAPFLTPDQDPYAVIRADGSLVMVQDLYTTAERFPYGAQVRGVGYIRNSVKAVMDCYNGSVTFYVVDERDPLARTYRNIYPSLFTSSARMPADIRAHLRYPEDMLAVQSAAYGIYHVKDPVTFYNHEDVWETGRLSRSEDTENMSVPALPYYMQMRLPAEERAEFLQMLPLSPREKDNMIAWVAGRCDSSRYGELVAYHLPKGTIAFGPRQISARINQEPKISQDLTLWNQQGSQVLRGNLLTVPVAGSFLYVEPLYIQATGGKIPELKRVIVATQDRIGYGASLEDALDDLFGATVANLASSSTPPAAVTETTGTPPAGDNRALVRSAAEHLRRYQTLMGQGRAADAGKELEELQRDLDALSR